MSGSPQGPANKVLIYRLASIGDTVVALPAFRLVARAFPNAERRVLTNYLQSHKAASSESILEGTGLIHGYMHYPIGSRSLRELWELRSEIRRWRPDLLVYLTEPRGRFKTVRDVLFFWLCGIRNVIGAPLRRDIQEPRQLDGKRKYESEASRLVRSIGELGDGRENDPASWDLSLNAREFRTADRTLSNWPGAKRFCSASVGTKADTKDWGVDNWRALFDRVSRFDPDLGLVLVGAPDEATSSDYVSSGWRGPILNICGRVNPRESAAVIARSIAFLGHDSGPMHLAAAVGVPCIAVFSARNKPGVWFPYGTENRILYHQTECFGCQLVTCEIHQKKCIRSITVDEVYAVTLELLRGRGG